jgi:hypothetical protein
MRVRRRRTMPGRGFERMTALPAAIEREDLAILRWATEHLEHPSLAARLTSAIGTPIEIAFKLLPRPFCKQLHAAADAAIGKAFEVAVSSLHHEHEVDPRNGLYRGLVAGTAAAGGAFGLSGLAFDLPVTTTLMLRSIAEIARRKYGQRLVRANDEAIRQGGVMTERRCET